MSFGSIKKVVADKGFGFVVDDAGREYFFHRSTLTSPATLEDLYQGQRVEFTAVDAPKGPRAEQVRLV